MRLDDGTDHKRNIHKGLFALAPAVIQEYCRETTRWGETADAELTLSAAIGVLETLKEANLTYEEVQRLRETNGDGFVNAICIIADGPYAPYVELRHYIEDAVVIFGIRETCKDKTETRCFGCEPEHHLPYCGSFIQEQCIRRSDGKRL